LYFIGLPVWGLILPQGQGSFRPTLPAEAPRSGAEAGLTSRG